MITIYGYPKTRARRVTWMMEELGEPYEFHVIKPGEQAFRTPEFLAINPAGKVPAIRDDDLILSESAAIVTYLGDKYADAGLLPAPNTAARGKYYQWSYFALAELEQPLWTIGKHKFALPKEYRIVDIFPTAQWEFQQALALLSQGLDGQTFILGDEFSAADLLLGHTLIWGRNFEQPIEQENLKVYADRLASRDALARAIEREEAALAAAG
jgi:glutathione S-transferase